MKFTQAVKMAVKSLLSNKMRSFLTILGIVIGIASVITMLGIGTGSTQAVTSAIEGMGTNLITINITESGADPLTDTELQTFTNFPTVQSVVPQVSQSVTAKNGETTESATMVGTLPAYEQVRDVSAAIGRFITDDDNTNRYKVAVVGKDIIQTLYPDLDVGAYQTLIGQDVELNGTKFKIVGILESKGTSMNGSDDSRVIVPLSTAERFLKVSDVTTYYVEAASTSSITPAYNTLNAYLYRKYGSTSDYTVYTQSELLETSSSAADSLALMLAGIAAISLLVGGIGIMNIMLVSVVERTREIGIRKAVGAKRGDILLQFLIEAVFVSCLGGLIGVGTGILAGVLIPLFSSQTVVLQVPIMVMAFAFSAAVGVIFGFYPAMKASKLRPIDALNYE